jgi:hypothetical protein
MVEVLKDEKLSLSEKRDSSHPKYTLSEHLKPNAETHDLKISQMSYDSGFIGEQQVLSLAKQSY